MEPRGTRLELTWPGKDQFLPVPRDETGKPVWVERLLTEQILGRGLRLPFGKRTGNPMLDTVEVLSHRSFASLLKQARVLLEETLGHRVDAATAVVKPTIGRHVHGVPLSTSGELSSAMDAPESGEVEIHLPGAAATDPDQLGLFDETEIASDAELTHIGISLATVDSRMTTAAEANKILTRTLTPRRPGGVRIPLFLAMVTTRWKRDPFSLTQINHIDVEALGRQFATDNAPTLRRKALDAQRDEEGQTKVVITDQSEVVYASQTTIPYGNIETDLVQRLMTTNGITATASEANAALAIARVFLAGTDVTSETPWRPEHGRLATTRLAEWINGKQTSSPAREVKEVTNVRWPEPTERAETRPPADRHVVTKTSEFTRGYPYSGWTKSVYEFCEFDAYATEFQLANLFETSTNVRAWVRINETVPLRIPYLIGAIQKHYEPDFVVIDDHARTGSSKVRPTPR